MKKGKPYLTITELRKDLYRAVDNVIESGAPLEFERKGVVLSIVPKVRTKSISNIKRKNIINGDPDDLTSIDWSKEWNELKKDRKTI